MSLSGLTTCGGGRVAKLKDWILNSKPLSAVKYPVGGKLPVWNPELMAQPESNPIDNKHETLNNLADLYVEKKYL